MCYYYLESPTRINIKINFLKMPKKVCNKNRKFYSLFVLLFLSFSISHSHFKLFLFGALSIIVFILAFFIKAVLYIIHKFLYPFFIINIFFNKLLAFLVLCTQVFDVWLYFLLQELSSFNLLILVLYFCLFLLNYLLFLCNLCLDLKNNEHKG